MFSDKLFSNESEDSSSLGDEPVDVNVVRTSVADDLNTTLGVVHVAQVEVRSLNDVASSQGWGSGQVQELRLSVEQALFDDEIRLHLIKIIIKSAESLV